MAYGVWQYVAANITSTVIRPESPDIQVGWYRTGMHWSQSGANIFETLNCYYFQTANLGQHGFPAEGPTTCSGSKKTFLNAEKPAGGGAYDPMYWRTVWYMPKGGITKEWIYGGYLRIGNEALDVLESALRQHEASLQYHVVIQ